MNEIDVLQDVFGPDEAPSLAAHDRARAALLDRLSGPAPVVRRRPRWTLRIAAAVLTAAAATVGVVAVENLNTATPGTTGRNGDKPPVAGRPVLPTLPFAKPAAAAEVLENAAFTAALKPWVKPRPDQFAYIERTQTFNDPKLDAKEPNAALVKGKTHETRLESWVRIDGKVHAGRTDGGKLDVADGTHFATSPYDELAGLTSPEKIDRYLAKPKRSGWSDPGMMILQEVLPPDVEAAVFRWYARKPGVKIDTNAVNLDGRPAVAVTISVDGWVNDDFLFDPKTYQLIGLRSVVVKDHVSEALDGTNRFKKGDVLNLEIRIRAGIVDKVGDTV
ncbi:hypothetical protein EV385_2488 [Krasilnikovia cinnamomea]|uniref:Uncharacterized protein n=1 Tax=Krasilnikovia cinnamomea TaxID=349313 RepID=A0A4Q7ZIN4_9ACTN|nr:CU044_5270 family protein [Krasilnikovia cinnamomea]RZU50708.1 hypothetical protein EV385_2488 [Krasilnikovia cinnamomea]